MFYKNISTRLSSLSSCLSTWTTFPFVRLSNVTINVNNISHITHITHCENDKTYTIYSANQKFYGVLIAGSGSFGSNENVIITLNKIKTPKDYETFDKWFTMNTQEYL